jgi:hypothetical protein
MGINGIAEAFLQGTGSEMVINLQTAFMVILWAHYLFSSWFLVIYCSYGSIGLIYSNILSMILRIFFAFRYIRNYFMELKFNNRELNTIRQKFKLGLIITNSPLLWMMFALSWLITRNTVALSPVMHLTTGVSLFCMLTCIIYAIEAKTFTELISTKKTK